MFTTKEYITSKKEEPQENCQDAYAINPDISRYAIADGATREFFSAKLAKELVKRFCFDTDDTNRDIFINNNHEEWLEPIQKSWLDFVNDIMKGKVNFVVKNRFNRRDSGASTFVGLEIDRDNNRFQAMIIGDSCLFHIRDNKILKSYLIEHDKDFDNSPNFFFSRNIKDMLIAREFIEPTTITRAFKEGDYFLLATDAIAKYLLKQKRLGKWEEIWESLVKEDTDWYKNFIENKRIDKDDILDDDDVAIVIISTDSLDKSTSILEDKKSVKLVEEEVKEKKVEVKPTFFIVYKSEKIVKEIKRDLESFARIENFDFFIQEKNPKIDAHYQHGILLIESALFTNSKKKDKFFTCFKFSQNEIDNYKYYKPMDYYYKEIKEIYYKDIKTKIPTILEEYKYVL